MEVKLDKRYPVAASVEQAWAVLCDVRATAACMPGAAITEQLDDTHYKGTVRSKVGPAVMQFAGEIEVLGLDAAARRLQMLGKGADKAGSSAAMELTAHLEPGDTPGTATLVGSAVVTVSGKLAQFGSRLLVPVSDAMLAQFAGNFSKAAGAVALAPAAADAAATPAAQAEVGVLPATVGADAAAVPAVASSTARAPAPASTLPAAASQPAAPPVNELNALALLWTVIKGWLAGLFGRRPT
jgi:hypothetical protein